MVSEMPADRQTHYRQTYRHARAK